MIQDDQSRESQRMSRRLETEDVIPKILNSWTHPDTSIHPRPPLARIT
jgi:hypothetical protein